LAIAIETAEKKESEKDPEEQAVKLVHLTADRPKGPPGRRAPPSRKPVAERQVTVVESEPPPGGFKEPVLVREKPTPKPPPTATSLVVIRIDVEDENVRQITMKKTAVVADAFISLKKKLPEKKNDVWSLTMIISGKETDVPYSSEQFLIELITCDPKDVKFKFKNITPPKPPLDPEVLEEMKRDLLREHELKKNPAPAVLFDDLPVSLKVSHPESIPEKEPERTPTPSIESSTKETIVLQTTSSTNDSRPNSVIVEPVKSSESAPVINQEELDNLEKELEDLNSQKKKLLSKKIMNKPWF